MVGGLDHSYDREPLTDKYPAYLAGRAKIVDATG